MRLSFLLAVLCIQGRLLDAAPAAKTSPKTIRRGGVSGLSAAPAFGVLLLAPGGEKLRAESAAMAKTLDTDFPVESVCGVSDLEPLQAAADRLEARGVKKIIIVPLALTSQSPVVARAKSAFGLKGGASLAPCPGGKGTCGRTVVSTNIPVALASALDDHPYPAEILVERLRERSRLASRQKAVLVGVGCSDKRSHKALERSLHDLRHALRKRIGFKKVRAAALRQGSGTEAREEDALLRELVRRESIDAKILLVPYALAWDDERGRVDAALKGLSYSWEESTLLPHPLMTDWVRETASAGARLEDMRRFAPGPTGRTVRDLLAPKKDEGTSCKAAEVCR